MDKQTDDLNEIHKMTPAQREAESNKLQRELSGHLNTAERTHKTSRKQLIDSHLYIGGDRMDTQDFKNAQARLGLTNPDMGKLICCGKTHLENLRRGYKLEKGSRVDVLPTQQNIRIIEQAEELQRLKAT